MKIKTNEFLIVLLYGYIICIRVTKEFFLQIVLVIRRQNGLFNLSPL